MSYLKDPVIVDADHSLQHQPTMSHASSSSSRLAMNGDNVHPQSPIMNSRRRTRKDRRSMFEKKDEHVSLLSPPSAPRRLGSIFNNDTGESSVQESCIQMQSQLEVLCEEILAEDLVDETRQQRGPVQKRVLLPPPPPLTRSNSLDSVISSQSTVMSTRPRLRRASSFGSTDDVSFPQHLSRFDISAYYAPVHSHQHGGKVAVARASAGPPALPQRRRGEMDSYEPSMIGDDDTIATVESFTRRATPWSTPQHSQVEFLLHHVEEEGTPTSHSRGSGSGRRGSGHLIRPDDETIATTENHQPQHQMEFLLEDHEEPMRGGDGERPGSDQWKRPSINRDDDTIATVEINQHPQHHMEFLLGDHDEPTHEGGGDNSIRRGSGEWKRISTLNRDDDTIATVESFAKRQGSLNNDQMEFLLDNVDDVEKTPPRGVKKGVLRRDDDTIATVESFTKRQVGGLPDRMEFLLDDAEDEKTPPRGVRRGVLRRPATGDDDTIATFESFVKQQQRQVVFLLDDVEEERTSPRFLMDQMEGERTSPRRKHARALRRSGGDDDTIATVESFARQQRQVEFLLDDAEHDERTSPSGKQRGILRRSIGGDDDTIATFESFAKQQVDFLLDSVDNKEENTQQVEFVMGDDEKTPPRGARGGVLRRPARDDDTIATVESFAKHRHGSLHDQVEFLLDHDEKTPPRSAKRGVLRKSATGDDDTIATVESFAKRNVVFWLDHAREERTSPRSGTRRPEMRKFRDDDTIATAESFAKQRQVVFLLDNVEEKRPAHRPKRGELRRSNSLDSHMSASTTATNATTNSRPKLRRTCSFDDNDEKRQQQQVNNRFDIFSSARAGPPALPRRVSNYIDDDCTGEFIFDATRTSNLAKRESGNQQVEFQLDDVEQKFTRDRGKIHERDRPIRDDDTIATVESFAKQRQVVFLLDAVKEKTTPPRIRGILKRSNSFDSVVSSSTKGTNATTNTANRPKLRRTSSFGDNDEKRQQLQMNKRFDFASDGDFRTGPPSLPRRVQNYLDEISVGKATAKGKPDENSSNRDQDAQVEIGIGTQETDESPTEGKRARSNSFDSVMSYSSPRRKPRRKTFSFEDLTSLPDQGLQQVYRFDFQGGYERAAVPPALPLRVESDSYEPRTDGRTNNYNSTKPSYVANLDNMATRRRDQAINVANEKRTEFSRTNSLDSIMSFTSNTRPQLRKTNSFEDDDKKRQEQVQRFDFLAADAPGAAPPAMPQRRGCDMSFEAGVAGSASTSSSTEIGSKMQRQAADSVDGEEEPPAGGDRFAITRTTSMETGLSLSSTSGPKPKKCSSFDDLERAREMKGFGLPQMARPSRTRKISELSDWSTPSQEGPAEGQPRRHSAVSGVTDPTIPSPESRTGRKRPHRFSTISELTDFSMPSQLTESTTEQRVSETIDRPADDENDASSVMSGLTNPTTFDFGDDDSNEDTTLLVAEQQERKSQEESSPRPPEHGLTTRRSSSSHSDSPHGSHAARMAHHASLCRLADKFRRGVPVRDHTYFFKKYENSFVGSEAIDFMVESGMVENREDAIFLGQRFVRELGLFHHVHWDHTILKDDFLFYRFTDDELADPGIVAASPIQSAAANHPESISSSDHSLSEGSLRRLSSSSNSPLISFDSSSSESYSSDGSTIDLNVLAELFKREVMVRTHSYHFKKYKNTFTGKEAVDRMVAANLAKNRLEAVFLGQRLMEDLGLFSHVKSMHTFKDENLFYCFDEKEELEESDSSSNLSVSLRTNTSTRSSSSSFFPLSPILKRSSKLEEPATPLPKVPAPQPPLLAGNLDSSPLAGNSTIMEDGDLPSESVNAPIQNISIAPGGVLIQPFHISSITDAAPQVPVRNASIVSGMISNPGSYITDADLASLASRYEKKEEHRVSFGPVLTRVYERSLDYNPSTSSGPSVGLGWSYKQEPPRELPDWRHQNNKPMSTKRFVLSRNDRERILEDCGYSRREIANAVRSNNRGREQRKETLNKLSARTMRESSSSSSSRNNNGRNSKARSKRSVTSMLGLRHD